MFEPHGSIAVKSYLITAIIAYIIAAMMTTFELTEHLSRLRLTQTEAAQLLGVSARTVRRWFDGEEVPGPAEAALRAWRRLDEQLLAWRPDSITIVEDHPERIASHRQHVMGLDGLLRRVEARGGPRSSWTVDIPESTATLGRMQVSFYKLQNGGFSWSVYTRRDMHPDLERDRPAIEDAIFCIAKEFAKAGQRAAALKAVAADVRSKSTIFGSYGPNLLDSTAKRERQQAIEGLADQIDALAEEAAAGRPTTAQQFEALRRQLSDAGYSRPDTSLISAVAKSYVERKEKVRILFVRSGRHDDPVTKVIESDASAVDRLIAGHQLKHLGVRLPPIGESTALQDFAGPDYVVLDVPRGAEVTGVDKPGLYLVADLRPSQV